MAGLFSVVSWVPHGNDREARMKLRRFVLILLLALIIVIVYCCVARPRSVSSEETAATLDVVISELAWIGTTVPSSDEWIPFPIGNTLSQCPTTSATDPQQTQRPQRTPR
jgi:hypothetical protein